MRKLPLALTLTTAGFFASQAFADLNVQAGANYWKPSPSGYIQGKKAEEELNVKQDLGLSSDSQTNFYVQLDHPMPMLPNLRFSRTSLDFTGSKTTDFTFLDTTFSGDLNTQVDLSHTDITAYYRFLDGLTSFIPLVDMRLELGLNVRLFDGEFAVSQTTSGVATTKQIALDAPVPMGHAAFRLGVPFGLSFGAQIEAIGYSGNSLTDLTLDARYEYDGLPLIKPGLTAGYRSFKAKLDDLSDTYGDLTLDGAFFGAYVKIGF